MQKITTRCRSEDLTSQSLGAASRRPAPSPWANDTEMISAGKIQVFKRTAVATRPDLVFTERVLNVSFVSDAAAETSSCSFFACDFQKSHDRRETLWPLWRRAYPDSGPVFVFSEQYSRKIYGGAIADSIEFFFIMSVNSFFRKRFTYNWLFMKFRIARLIWWFFQTWPILSSDVG